MDGCEIVGFILKTTSTAFPMQIDCVVHLCNGLNRFAL